MKKILFFAAMLFVAAPNIHAKGDDEDVKIVLVKEENSDNYYYEGVVPVDGISKEEMFKRAKEWVLSNFKTGDVNTQFDEANLQIYNAPTIIIKVFPDCRACKDDYANFKLKLLFKDGKYKFRFDNVIVNSNVLTIPATKSYNDVKMFPGSGVKYNRKIIEDINKAFFSFSVNLENAIKATGTKKDDW